MSELNLKTNNRWRDFSYDYEVPEEVMADQFSYHLDQPEDDRPTDGYFKYRGVWYHLDQFMQTEPAHPDWLTEWSGYLNDSFFSGVVVKLSDDGEQYKVGTFFS